MVMSLVKKWVRGQLILFEMAPQGRIR